MATISNNTVYLDANVLLEILSKRQQATEAISVVRAHAGRTCISALSTHLLYHFGTKLTTIELLKDFIAEHTILSLESADFAWAYNNRRNDDFEDALQVAVAVRNGCHKFYTFDRRLYGKYTSLPAMEFCLLPSNTTT